MYVILDLPLGMRLSVPQQFSMIRADKDKVEKWRHDHFRARSSKCYAARFSWKEEMPDQLILKQSARYVLMLVNISNSLLKEQMKTPYTSSISMSYFLKR